MAASRERFVLAADVGGTKTNLALYPAAAARLEPAREGRRASGDYACLEDLVRDFLGSGPVGVEAAVFGIAGPVIEGSAKLTNLPWKVESGSLSEALGGARVRLMNDLETSAFGALHLEGDQITALQEGEPRAWHRAVIAAGTGLGQAVLFFDGERYRTMPTEGGHAAFAPRNEAEMELLRFLLRRYERVSVERVVSGPGLRHIFEFVRDELGVPVDPALAVRLEKGDPSAAIGEAGVAGSCPASRRAVEWFAELYGAQAANHALSTLALGGVYVAGGIVVKLLPVIREGGFLRAFRDVGRFSELLARVPVRVVLEPRASLLGAARAALELV